jgi:AcrR family transcriptional regulator
VSTPTPRPRRSNSPDDDRQSADAAPVPVWLRPEPTPRRPPTTLQDIAAAAIALADREGGDAITMRRVAAEAGVPTMSLYTYVKNKEELIDVVADEICREMIVEEPLPTDWREALTMIARRSFAFFRNNSWVLSYIDQPDPAAGPNIMRHMDQSVAAVQSLPLDSQTRLAVLHVVDQYVLGAAMSHLDEERQQVFREEQDERTARNRAFFETMLATGNYPHLSADAEASSQILEGSPGDLDLRFELGLKWLLDGIEAEIDRPTQAPADSG